MTLLAGRLVSVGRNMAFGAFGPKHQVGQLLRQSINVETVRIRMVDTCEEAKYRYTFTRRT